MPLDWVLGLRPSLPLPSQPPQAAFDQQGCKGPQPLDWVLGLRPSLPLPSLPPQAAFDQQGCKGPRPLTGF